MPVKKCVLVFAVDRPVTLLYILLDEQRARRIADR
jgi:hypothetical protein